MDEASKAASDPTLLAKGMAMANQVQNEVKNAAGDDAASAAEVATNADTKE